MGNRFATLVDYHKLILGHGILAAITFLFIIPLAVFLARYYTRQPGSAVRYHAYLQVLAVGLTTVVFVLGFFAVGPPRNLTNPHHGIGVAIYVLILVQAFGGRLVKKLAGRRSFRLHVHRWSGRMIALLGIVQVPLGLTLYGSPKSLFILFAVWMAFLVFVYFVLDYRDYGRRDGHGGHGGHGHGYAGDESSRVTSKPGGKMKWLAPLAVGAGALALFRGRKKHKDAERGMSRSPSPLDRSHRGREPTVISSRRESDSYYDEKRPDQRRASGGGGFMNKLFGAGAALGAGALVTKMMNRGDRRHDDEYSAVATDTPGRPRRHRPPPRSEFTESEYTERTEDIRRHPSRRDDQSSVLPPPRPLPPGAGPPRPMTPRRSHPAHSRMDSTVDASDYSSYVSPSRRTPERRKSGGGVGKGLLAGMGLGFLANMGRDKRDRREEERLRDEEDRRRDEEEERRAGRRSSRYTGDGYATPSRRESKRLSKHQPRPPPSGVTMTETSVFSGGESSIEPRGNTPYDPAPPGFRPPPPLVAPIPGAPPVPGPPPIQAPGPIPIPIPMPIPSGTASGPHSRQQSRHDVSTPAAMPAMPVDPHGIFHHPSDSSDAYGSPSTRRTRPGNAAAAAALASASALNLASEEERSRRETTPVTVKMQMRGDDHKIKLWRLTEEESRREQQRRGSSRRDSVSSLSGNDTPTTTGRRYRRRDSRAETAAEKAAEKRIDPSDDNESSLHPLSPPNPAYARRAAGKDSAYYSSGAGPSGAVPAAGATMSTLNSPGEFNMMSPGGSQATFTTGPMTDATAAADRRRRRRLERRADAGGRGQQGTSVDYD